MVDMNPLDYRVGGTIEFSVCFPRMFGKIPSVKQTYTIERQVESLYVCLWSASGPPPVTQLAFVVHEDLNVIKRYPNIEALLHLEVRFTWVNRKKTVAIFARVLQCRPNSLPVVWSLPNSETNVERTLLRPPHNDNDPEWVSDRLVPECLGIFQDFDRLKHDLLFKVSSTATTAQVDEDVIGVSTICVSVRPLEHQQQQQPQQPHQPMHREVAFLDTNLLDKCPICRNTFCEIRHRGERLKRFNNCDHVVCAGCAALNRRSARYTRECPTCKTPYTRMVDACSTEQITDWCRGVKRVLELPSSGSESEPDVVGHHVIIV